MSKYRSVEDMKLGQRKRCLERKLEKYLAKLIKVYKSLGDLAMTDRQFNNYDSKLIELLDNCSQFGINVNGHRREYEMFIREVEKKYNDRIEGMIEKENIDGEWMPSCEQEKRGYRIMKFIPSLYGYLNTEEKNSFRKNKRKRRGKGLMKE